MPFQVYLSPTTASPPDAQVQADVRAAISAEGAKIAPDGVTVVMSDGLRIKLARDDEHFLVDQLSPSFCRVVFNAAQRSNSTVDRGGSDVTPLQMNGSRGVTRYVRMRTERIADAAALCARLSLDLHDWKRFISDAQSEGIVGSDEQPLEPPPGPGTETRLNSDPTGVSAHCEAVQQAFAGRGWKIVRRVISQNTQYGVVWRADVTAPGYSREATRVICWRRPGRADYSIVDRPLKMFDPAESAAPLGR
jgi:hypothetical protein